MGSCPGQMEKVLEPSERDAFGHLPWMENVCVKNINIFEGLSSGDVLPSPNVGLPGALIPRERPGSAYVTHTGPLVRLLLQERPGKAPPARAEPRTQPRGSGPEQRSPAPANRSGGSAAGIQGDATGIPKESSASAPPALCHMIVFARKAPSAVPPRRNLACSSHRE